jgi:hypothetical protein
MLPDMVNFVIQSYYPDIWAAHGGEGSSLTQRQDMYLAFFRWGVGWGGDVCGGAAVVVMCVEVVGCGAVQDMYLATLSWVWMVWWRVEG